MYTFRNKYIDVAQLLEGYMEGIKDKQLREYLGRTAISRAYEGVFLELYFYITEVKGVSYQKLKKMAKEYYLNKGIKIPINKHTSVGAYISVNYGEVYGELYELLRKVRNDVDYNIELKYLNKEAIVKEVNEYIKIAKIILYEVIRDESG